MENTKVLAIIDVDGLFYHCSKDDFYESLATFDQRMENIIKKTGATHFVGFCSISPYFRNEIDPEYKQNRKDKPMTLKWIKSLRSYAMEKYGVRSYKKLEADDLCAYWMNKDLVWSKLFKEKDGKTHDIVHRDYIGTEEREEIKKVLCSPDKDLLESIEGEHFNYTYKPVDKKKEDSEIIQGWFKETSKIEAERFIWYQMLVGDTSDNVLGCGIKVQKIWKSGAKEGQTYYARQGVGPKDANKYLDNMPENEHYASYILKLYLKTFGTYKGIINFQKNFRVLNMLNCVDSYLAEGIDAPSKPNIIQVRIEEDNPEKNKEIDTKNATF